MVEERQLAIKILETDQRKVRERKEAQQNEDERGASVLSRPEAKRETDESSE